MFYYGADYCRSSIVARGGGGGGGGGGRGILGGVGDRAHARAELQLVVVI